MSATYILIATLTGYTPHGVVNVPLTGDFKVRAECVAHVDQHIQAARSQVRGPLTLTVMAFCEQKAR